VHYPTKAFKFHITGVIMIVKEDKVLTLPKSYFDFLKDIKVRIKNSQIKAAVV